MRILVAQLNPTIGDLEGNTDKILLALDRARTQEMDLVLFPELTITGYPPEDLLLHPSFIDAVDVCLEKIVHGSYGIACVVGLPRRNLQGQGKGLFNSAAVIEDGKLLGYQDKWLLPTYDVFDERRYFEPGTTMQIWNF